MKPRDEIQRLHGRIAPMATFGSFLAGYRAAERSITWWRDLAWGVVIPLLILVIVMEAAL